MLILLTGCGGSGSILPETTLPNFPNNPDSGDSDNNNPTNPGGETDPNEPGDETDQNEPENSYVDKSSLAYLSEMKYSFTHNNNDVSINITDNNFIVNTGSSVNSTVSFNLEEFVNLDDTKIIKAIKDNLDKNIKPELSGNIETHNELLLGKSEVDLEFSDFGMLSSTLKGTGDLSFAGYVRHIPIISGKDSMEIAQYNNNPTYSDDKSNFQNKMEFVGLAFGGYFIDSEPNTIGIGTSNLIGTTKLTIDPTNSQFIDLNIDFKDVVSINYTIDKNNKYSIAFSNRNNNLGLDFDALGENAYFTSSYFGEQVISEVVGTLRLTNQK